MCCGDRLKERVNAAMERRIERNKLRNPDTLDVPSDILAIHIDIQRDFLTRFVCALVKDAKNE